MAGIRITIRQTRASGRRRTRKPGEMDGDSGRQSTGSDSGHHGGKGQQRQRFEAHHAGVEER